MCAHAYFISQLKRNQERRCFDIGTKEQLINEEIREKEVRVVGADGEQLGIMATADALAKAIEADLDLVLIAPTANPPVCKIMDFGKYRFEQTKREKEARKNQKQAEVKEIKMSLNIDTNDFNIKVKNCIKFLQNGDKVKVTIRFRRAREMSHMNLSEEVPRCRFRVRRFRKAVKARGQELRDSAQPQEIRQARRSHRRRPNKNSRRIS